MLTLLYKIEEARILVERMAALESHSACDGICICEGEKIVLRY